MFRPVFFINVSINPEDGSLGLSLITVTDFAAWPLSVLPVSGVVIGNVVVVCIDGRYGIVGITNVEALDSVCEIGDLECDSKVAINPSNSSFVKESFGRGPWL